MRLEFGTIQITIPNYMLPRLVDLALDKGFSISDKLIDAEAVMYSGLPPIVDINHEELLELASILVEVIR